MTGKQILDQADKIIKRQDLDREQLLFFVNTVRKSILREKIIPKFYKYLTNVTVTNGVIDTTDVISGGKSYHMKTVRIVEYFNTDSEGTVTKVALAKLPDYRTAMMAYGSLTVIGNPQAYLESGITLNLLPFPTEGSINLYGEVWPDDITDSVASSDITTVEIPEAWVYLSSAEYLDMLGEADKANYWRQKGLAIIDSYIRQIKYQQTNDIDMMKRDPFGNMTQKTPLKSTYSSVTLEDLDLGGY